jgi:hypothetical protein
MSKQNYTTSFTVNQTPEEVFKAINNVRGWWTGKFEGNADKLGAEFTYRYAKLHFSTQKVTEFVPGKRVVWHVEEATINFVENKHEWKDTDIVFDIAEKDGKTEVTFTHVGLQPQVECYGACSDAWRTLIHGNLRQLIETGEDQPDAF